MTSDTDRSEQAAPVDWERYRDAEWAIHDPGVQQLYEGQWVVAFERQIIAHGPDALTVAEQARRQVPEQRHLLAYCAREDPAHWLKHAADGAIDFRNA
jgi:hypothetical protein